MTFNLQKENEPTITELKIHSSRFGYRVFDQIRTTKETIAALQEESVYCKNAKVRASFLNFLEDLSKTKVTPVTVKNLLRKHFSQYHRFAHLPFMIQPFNWENLEKVGYEITNFNVPESEVNAFFKMITPGEYGDVYEIGKLYSLTGNLFKTKGKQGKPSGGHDVYGDRHCPLCWRFRVGNNKTCFEHYREDPLKGYRSSGSYSSLLKMKTIFYSEISKLIEEDVNNNTYNVFRATGAQSCLDIIKQFRPKSFAFLNHPPLEFMSNKDVIYTVYKLLDMPTTSISDKDHRFYTPSVEDEEWSTLATLAVNPMLTRCEALLSAKEKHRENNPRGGYRANSGRKAIRQ